MSSITPTVELPYGASMPRLGLGTWPVDDAGAERAVAQALELTDAEMAELATLDEGEAGVTSPEDYGH